MFLSSTLDGELMPGIREERARIHAHGQQYGDNAVWVDEISHPKEDGEFDPLRRVDDLLAEIDQSPLYLVLVGTDRAGSAIKVSTQSSQVSFFEIELFYAALRGRPIVVVERSDITRAPRTVEMLRLLRQTLPEASWYTAHSVQQAESLCNFFVDKVAARELSTLGRIESAYSALLLGLWRSVESQPSDGHVEWLGGTVLSGPERPNVTIIDACLDHAASGYSLQQRLSRVWVASRELMRYSWLEDSSQEWLPYWNRVFAAWNKAGGWYGLHGHIDLGYLAALNSMETVSRRWRTLNPSAEEDPAWDPPYSAQASAYYALARRVGSLRYRFRGMKRALRLADMATPRDDIGRSNVLSIRASILKGLGAFRSANEAYERVLELRVSAGASEGAIGEAMTELGFGLLFTLHWVHGHALLHDGVTMMRRASYSPGFLVRALRKEAIACRLLGRFREAKELDQQARDVAEKASVARISWKR
ncbi:MAG: hypothetical protein HY084_12085 [Gemmatimonadetes bacterium]|nr:hypothetical protein [Gemmatimonadota bacterium]